MSERERPVRTPGCRAPTEAEVAELRAQLDDREVATAFRVLARLLRAGGEALAREQDEAGLGDPREGLC